MELNDYVRDTKHGIVGLTETKLYGRLESLDIEENKFHIWKRNRKTKQGGVMLLARKDEITCGGKNAKVVKVQVRGKGNFAVVYVPIKTNS